MGDNKLIYEWGFGDKKFKSDLMFSSIKNQYNDFPKIIIIGKQNYFKL